MASTVEPQNRNLGVIVVGAGIAGLTLANILKKTGIKCTILEAQEDFERPVGGSYGIWPNAARILDQIDCWTDVQQNCSPIEANHIRLPNGEPIKSGDVASLAGEK